MVQFRFSDPYLNRFLQPDTIIPSLYNPQSLNRYSFVGNNPINYSDPTGHWRTEDTGSRNGCYDTKYCNGGQPKSSDELKAMRNPKINLPYGTNSNANSCSGDYQSILCLPNRDSNDNFATFPPDGQPKPNSANSGYSNPELDALLGFWNNVVSPVAISVDAYDVYNLSGTKAYKYAKYGLPLGILEGIVAGVSQYYRDTWYQSLSPTQRTLRPIVAGVEALMTDKIATLTGEGAEAGGLIVGGPLGAAGAYLAGATFATKQSEAFSMNVINPGLFSRLGVWP